MRLQGEAKTVIARASSDLFDAAELFRMNGLGDAFRMPSLLLGLHRDLGLQSSNLDQFLRTTIEAAEAHCLRELKHHTRVPVQDAWALVGVADEWDFLPEGQIYAHIRPAGATNSQPFHLSGQVCISRSPVASLGDVRLVTAYGKPPSRLAAILDGVSNVVVFSARGTRSLPSMLGGGDLGTSMLYWSAQMIKQTLTRW